MPLWLVMLGTTKKLKIRSIVQKSQILKISLIKKKASSLSLSLTHTHTHTLNITIYNCHSYLFTVTGTLSPWWLCSTELSCVRVWRSLLRKMKVHKRVFISLFSNAFWITLVYCVDTLCVKIVILLSVYLYNIIMMKYEQPKYSLLF